MSYARPIGALVWLVLLGTTEAHETGYGSIGLIGVGSAQDQALVDRFASWAYQALASRIAEEGLLTKTDLALALCSAMAPDPDQRELGRLQELFQKGYIQSYSFEYQAALANFQSVLMGLEKLKPSPAGLDLWIRSHIFVGIAQAGLKDIESCLESFAIVLRLHPEMTLSRQEYSPKIIELWEQAKASVEFLPQGKLEFESEPSGATVFVDGIERGQTPLGVSLAQGDYWIEVVHPDFLGAVCRVQNGSETTRVKFELSFQGAIQQGLDVPLIHLPEGEFDLPPRWWDWLKARLSADHLILVNRIKRNQQPQWVASLADLKQGRILREGWLEPRGISPEDLRQDAEDLIDFLITGRAGQRVKAALILADANRIVPETPALSDGLESVPWYRKWWPYTIAGTVFVVSGIVSQVTSNQYTQRAEEALTIKDIEANEELADQWRGVAISAYVLGGALVILGIVLDATDSPADRSGPKASALTPWVGNLGWGLQWSQSF